MGRKKRFQIQMKQREKRKKFRKQLAKGSRNPEEYLYGSFYIKLGTS